MENVLGNEWGMPPYFGSVSHEWDAWTTQLSRYLNYKLPGWRENITLSGEQRSGTIRIAIFQRQEAMNGDRKYLNLPDVLSIVANYTSDYDVITTTSKTNLTKILKSFNSFDILITPHGSHIANVMFTLRTDVVIIETVGVCVNSGPRDWFSHRLNYLISSVMHLINRMCKKSSILVVKSARYTVCSALPPSRAAMMARQKK